MTPSQDQITAISHMASRMRKRILDMSFSCGSNAHLGGGLSIVDITASLYGAILNFDRNDPLWPERDRFILSKGHGVLGFYPALVEAGIMSEATLATFKHNESELIAHPVFNPALGIESSNGSLGQGLSFGIGLAWAARRQQKNHRVFVLLGDGECNEGAVWEAAMCAAHQRLGNLLAIVDHNGFQSDGASAVVLNNDALAAQWASFGWETRLVDGHDIAALIPALSQRSTEGKPVAVIARTTKGKGISFMENNNDWHHNRLTRTLYEQAVQELEGGN